MSAISKEQFNERLENIIPNLPTNATIESVNYNTDVKLVGDSSKITPSILIIYSTPLDAD